MTNRREFLQAAAIAALPLAAGAAGVERPMRYRSPTFRTVLVDERHEETRSFAARMASSREPVRAIPDGDITEIWLREIRPAWQRYPAPVAGLTERPALFCLEQLALASGLRVILHAEHTVHPGGEVEHSVLRGGVAGTVRYLSARDLMRAGPQWPGVVAHAVSFPLMLVEPGRPGLSSAALAPALPPGAKLLTSWIIAPV
jgi:hypothetical protein